MIATLYTSIAGTVYQDRFTSRLMAIHAYDATIVRAQRERAVEGATLDLGGVDVRTWERKAQ